MDRALEILRVVISGLGWICGLIVLIAPIWFLTAALGTKWSFWDWQFGLETLTYAWGQPLLITALATGALSLALIGLHRILARDFHGVFSVAILAVLIGTTGLVWDRVLDQRRDGVIVVLDVTTDPTEPPHFSSNFRARYGADLDWLDYAAKTDAEGRPLWEVQAGAYPEIVPLRLADAPNRVFRRALLQAREAGWNIGTASERAGMFEAGTESFWFGFRDDMVIRVRPDGEGGSIVDMRSISRDPVNDLGRNPQRVRDFLDALTEAGLAAAQVDVEAGNDEPESDASEDEVAPEAG